ncbi:MAG: hypothetical protein GY835_17940 [bacterium]|nr:hypothetical protein [bacterium]
MRFKTITNVICLFLAVFASSLAYAQNPPEEGERRFHFLLGAGGMVGGDELVNYTYDIITPGLPYSSEGTSDIKAGTGAQLFLGGSYGFDSIPFELELTLGWKVHRSKRIDDKETTFERCTVESLLYYRYDVVRLGGGLVNHLNPTLNEKIVTGESFKFDDALGYCLDVGYAGNNVAVSVRYTVIEYVFEGEPLKAGGKNIGLYVTISI